MLITPNIANAPPAPPQANNAARPAENGFAQLLNREQVKPADKAPEPSSDEHTESSTDENNTSSSTRAADDARAARTRAAARPGTNGNTKRAPETKSDAAEAATAKNEKPEKADEPAADATPVVDPALAHWLANLHLPPAAPAEGATAGVAAAGAATGGKAIAALTGAADGAAGAMEADTGNAVSGHKGASAHAAGRRDDHTDKLSAPALREAAEKSAAAANDKAAAVVSDTPATQTPAPSARGFEAAAGALTAGPAPAPVAAAPAPVTVVVPAALDTAEFAQAFGVQVSVLARDGVEHAELQLNPAEMGPVSVQIVMDGTHARIDFGADAAGTRQAIEHSLPDLAAALREAGLTLSGGGVSQHAQGRGNDTPGQGEQRSGAFAARSGDAQAAATPAQRWRGSVSAGGVDLYA